MHARAGNKRLPMVFPRRNHAAGAACSPAWTRDRDSSSAVEDPSETKPNDLPHPATDAISPPYSRMGGAQGPLPRLEARDREPCGLRGEGRCP